MNYVEAIIKLVPQIRNVSGLKQLYGHARNIKEKENRHLVATSQQGKEELDPAGLYRQYITELLEDVNNLRTLRFIYSFLQPHIRRNEEFKGIVHSQYKEVQ